MATKKVLQLTIQALHSLMVDLVCDAPCEPQDSFPPSCKVRGVSGLQDAFDPLAAERHEQHGHGFRPWPPAESLWIASQESHSADEEGQHQCL